MGVIGMCLIVRTSSNSNILEGKCTLIHCMHEIGKSGALGNEK